MYQRALVITLMIAAGPAASPAQEAAQAPVALQPTQAQLEQVALAIWQQSLAHLQANEPRKAIPLLENLVSLAPRVTRFRLELARTYFLVGEDDKATFHFRQALGDPLSGPERAAVQSYLDQMAARKTWEVGLSVQMLTESNPGKRTEAEVIDIGGLPFVLTDTAESGTGYEASARFTWLPKLDRDTNLRLSFGVTDRGFPDDDLDERRFDVEAGLVERADGGTETGFGLTASTRDIAGEDFSDSYGVYGSYSTTPDPATRLSLRGSLVRTIHDELSNRDGNTLSFGLNAQRVIASDLAIRGSLSASLTKAAADFESGKTLGFTVGATYAMAGGLVALGDMGVTLDTKDAPSGLFSETREDVTYFFAVRGLYRDFQVEGFTPVVGLRWEERLSTLDLYDYDNLSFTFGLSREF